MLENSGPIVYSNGKFFKNDDPLINGLNRGFLYGETLFTTMRTFDGKYLFFKEHMERLEKGISFLFPDNTTAVVEKIKVGLDKCLEKSKDWKEQDFKVRIPVYLENHQFVMTQEKNHLDFFIIAEPMATVNHGPIKLAVAKKMRTSGLVPSYLKVGSYTESIVEIREAKKNGYDDVLYLMENNKLAECSTSNIFFRMGEKIYSPEIVNGILDGITRRKLIECLAENGIEVEVGPWDLNDALNADELWVTSSVSGIRAVEQLEYKKYNIDQSAESITNKLVTFYKSFCAKDVI